MLSEVEKKEIQEEMKMYPVASAACLSALKIVQEHRGWVSDEGVKAVAGMLNMSNEEVESVATFYSRIYRKPVGRNVILVCDGISCMIMGHENIYEHIKEKLGISYGETTSDDRFTVLPISCLGDCDHAPSLMVNNDHYNELTVEKLEAILSQYK
ncbi:MAG: NADH-quinone oxidoreductase subunit NuoE [Bacteroidales bacterium]|nr:NADH-quinone oxidoreductase subunit NuoE [Bacteroidales bacterium]